MRTLSVWCALAAVFAYGASSVSAAAPKRQIDIQTAAATEPTGAAETGSPVSEYNGVLYSSHDEMNSRLKAVADKCEDITQVYSIGKSVEGRELHVIEFSTSPGINNHMGWAFGLGLERLAMVLYDIPDIRLFWSEDERFLKQFKASDKKVTPFTPFSRHPPNNMDVAFWLPEDGQFVDNDFFEMVRTEAGDLVEKITMNTVYTLAEEDTKLGRRIRHSLEVLQRAIDLYGIHGISLSFNGGKDCTLVLYLWVAACVKAGDLLEDPIHTLYVLEHFCFTEIQEFVDSCAQRFNLDLITKEGTIKEGLGTMLGKYPEIKGVIIGARHTDPFYGNMDELQMTDEDWPQVMRIHPILQWSYQNVWECLLRIGEPVCELYKKGYTSVGNTHNTHPNPALRNESIEGGYDPAWKLTDGTLERAGRDKKKS